MIVKCQKNDEQIVESYIGKEYYKCLYLYMNLQRYGIGSQAIDVYMDKRENEIKAVYLFYFSCVHVYSKDNDFSVLELKELIKDHPTKMIYCEKNTAEYIGDDYSSSERPFTITYGWVAEITNVDKKHRETVQSASVTDFEQIVQMIYDDEDIGKSYNKNDLAKQLLQRSKEGYSRNYVIKKNDTVIAHACTNAEINGIAIVAELIVNKEYRGRGYALEIWRVICEKLLSEGKRVFSFYYSNESRSLHKKVGFHEICEWGKIVFDNNCMEV